MLVTHKKWIIRMEDNNFIIEPPNGINFKVSKEKVSLETIKEFIDKNELQTLTMRKK